MTDLDVEIIAGDRVIPVTVPDADVHRSGRVARHLAGKVLGLENPGAVQFVSARLGRVIDADETLVEAGLRDGDALTLEVEGDAATVDPVTQVVPVAAGTPAAAWSPRAAPPPPPPPPQHAAPTPSAGGRRWVPIVAVIAVLTLAGAGVAAAVVLRPDDDPPAAAETTEPEARTVTVPGETVTTVVTDTRTDAAPDTDDDVVDDAPPPSTGRTVAGPGYVMTVPRGTGWTVGAARTGNGGRQLLRRIVGPGGIVIRIVHTPDFEAKPGSDFVVASEPIATPAASASRVTLEDFPTPECEQQLCDDFVLNDPAFGGLAILVNGTGDDDAAQAALAIAESVEPS